MKAEKKRCKKCGKETKEDGILLPTLHDDIDIVLCARCFEKMSMVQIWALELNKGKGKKYEKAESQE